MGSQSSWIIFIICVIIASFVGGAARLLFSQEQVHQIVREYIDNEDFPFDLAFDSINISLSNGLWPRFGIEARELKVSSQDPCLIGAQLDIDRAYLPLSFFSLLGQKLQFGKITIAKAHLNWLSDEICDSSGGGSPDVLFSEKTVQRDVLFSEKTVQRDVKKTVQREVKKIQKFMKERWQSELRYTHKLIKGFEVKDLTISHRGEPLVEVEEAFMYLTLNGEKLVIESRWKSYKNWMKGLNSVYIKFEADSKIQQMFITSRVKEGKIKLHARTNMESSRFDVDIDVRHLPLQEVGRVLNKDKNLDLGLQPKMFWLNCQGQWRGLLNHLEKSQIQTNSCQFVGDKGRVYFSDLQINPWKKPLVKKVSMKISNLSVKRVSKSFPELKLQGILDRFGFLNGEVNFLPETGWKGFLSFRDMALAFSRRGKRLAQKVVAARLSGTYDEKRGLSVKVDDVQMENGILSGDVVLNLDKSLQNGLFRMKITKLNFEPKIQALMVGQSIAPLRLDLSAYIRQGDWKKWVGDVRSAQIKGQNFTVDGFRLRGEFEKETFEGKVVIQKSTFTSEHPYFPWLTPLFLDGNQEKKRVDFKQLMVDLSFNASGGTWKTISGQEFNNSFRFYSEGKWQQGGKFSGTIVTKNHEYPHLTWELGGWASRGDLNLTPQTQVIKVLSRGSLGEDMSPQDRWEYVKNFGKERDYPQN